jgi:hypothetical protein
LADGRERRERLRKPYSPFDRLFRKSEIRGIVDHDWIEPLFFLSWSAPKSKADRSRV